MSKRWILRVDRYRFDIERRGARMQRESGAGRFLMVLAAGVLMVVGVLWLSQTGNAEEEPVPYVSVMDME